ncbi:MAG: RNA-binding protein [Phycisphaerales bacterium]
MKRVGNVVQSLMKLYVGNLSFNTSEDELRAAFEAFGAVRSASLVMDRMTGRPRGFAFVEMDDDAHAKAAIEGLHGKNLGGRDLTVNEARPPERGGGGSRGGYGGGGGGGYGGGGGGGYGGGGGGGGRGGYGGGGGGYGGGGGRGGSRGGGGRGGDRRGGGKRESW